MSVFGIHLVQPVVQPEVGAVQQQVPPVGDIVVADFLFPFGALDDRVYEVYVRVHQLIPFYAGGTSTAGIGFRPVGTADVAGIGKCQWEFSYSGRATEELCVGDTSFLHFLYQPLLGCLLAYYVLETEHGLISYKLLLVTLPIVNCQLLIVHCLVDLFGYFLDAVCSSYRVEVEAWDAMGYQLFALLHAPFDTHLLSFRIGVALQNLLGQFLG